METNTREGARENSTISQDMRESTDWNTGRHSTWKGRELTTQRDQGSRDLTVFSNVMCVFNYEMLILLFVKLCHCEVIWFSEQIIFGLCIFYPSNWKKKRSFEKLSVLSFVFYSYKKNISRFWNYSQSDCKKSVIGWKEKERDRERERERERVQLCISSLGRVAHLSCPVALDLGKHKALSLQWCGRFL